jgi:glycine/D-amino acid oxidase-like deaminating enzyme/nitrite reductase/ring-hydroxylating ferredoxin subunit
MNASDEASTSIWMTTEAAKSTPTLSSDTQADTIVVGSGIAGLSTAYELARSGKTVIVLDRGKIGGGMTSRTTAHLATEFDDYYHRHIAMRGIDEARGYFASQSAAIDRIESISRQEKIDCDFARVDGFLFAARDEDAELLRREREACLHIGMDGVELVRASLRDGPLALRFPQQARFHPVKYLGGLARCILRDKGRLFANTAVVSVSEQDGGVIVETTSGHRLRAASAVIATNSPINDWVEIHTKQAPYRTYAIACSVPKGGFTDALFWDTCEPYHYMRLQPGDHTDWLIVGGEDHKTGEANDLGARLERLEQWTLAMVPQASRAEYRWSGQVMEPVDHAPYVGRNPGSQNVYIVTGDSGEGVTTGVAASLLIPALVSGRDIPWSVTYAPDRITIGATGKYLSENATVAANLSEYAISGDVSSGAELQPGQAAVFGRGRDKVAAYRDESGGLHERSAICTHAGCVVHWNSLEKCWDCPCHGSQFSIDGEVLNGPAIYDLQSPKTD